MQYTPYTYLVGWSAIGQYYYGVRFAKNCHPTDLWVKYFTSSKHVKQLAAQYGIPDVIQVRRTFQDAASAKKWEDTVLRRCNVAKSKVWINKHQNDGLVCGETVSSFKKGHIPWSTGKNLQYQNGMKGKKLSDNRRAMMSAQKVQWDIDHPGALAGERNPMFGKTHSDEVKAKMRERMLVNNPMSYLPGPSIGKRWYAFEDGTVLYVKDTSDPKFTSGIPFKYGRKW